MDRWDDDAGQDLRRLKLPHSGHALARQLVVRVHGDRVTVGFHRLDLIVLLLVGEAEASPGVCIFRIDIQGGVEILDRRVIFARGDKALPARLIRSAREGVPVDRIVEIGDRLRMIALALVNQPARVESLRALRIERDLLIEIGERFRQMALRAQ